MKLFSYCFNKLVGNYQNIKNEAPRLVQNMCGWCDHHSDMYRSSQRYHHGSLLYNARFSQEKSSQRYVCQSSMRQRIFHCAVSAHIDRRLLALGQKVLQS